MKRLLAIHIASLIWLVLAPPRAAGQGTPPLQPVRQFGLSPASAIAVSADGTQVVVGSGRRVIRINAQTGEVLRLYIGMNDTVLSVAWSPNGKKIAASGYENVFRIWDVDDGEPIAASPQSGSGTHSARIVSLVFSPDGNRILTGSGDGTAKLWSVAGPAVLRTFQGNVGTINAVAFAAANASKVLTGGSDGRVKLWNSSTGAVIDTYHEAGEPVTTVAVSADWTRYASSGLDKKVHIWDAAWTTPKYGLSTLGQVSSRVCFSPDGGLVASGGTEDAGGGTVHMWNPATGALVHSYPCDPVTIRDVAFTSDGTKFLTSNYSCVDTWKVSDGSMVNRLNESGSVLAAAITPDGSRIVTGDTFKTARIWETRTGRLLKLLNGHTGSVKAVAISPNGARVLTASADGTAKIWDTVAGGAALLTLGGPNGHASAVNAAAWSPDGTRIVTAGIDGTARIWNASGTWLRTLSGHTDSIEAVAWAPAGNLILTGGADRTVRGWNPAGGPALWTLNAHSDTVTALALDRTGERFATGSADMTVKLWMTATRNPILTLPGHTDRVNSLAWAPAGVYLLSGSWDMEARLWNINLGRTVQRIQDHLEPVMAVAFNADGTQGVTASTEGNALLWNLPFNAAGQWEWYD